MNTERLHQDNNINRVQFIDVARSVAIFLVVWGHTAGGNISKTIYSFHMPLFFLISGMLLKRKNINCSISDIMILLKRRLKAYYIPYLVWALFYANLSLSNFVKICYGTREYLVDVGGYRPYGFCQFFYFQTLLLK